MHHLADLKPKQRDALVDACTAQLRRCLGGYRAGDAAAVHSKRTVNQLEREGLVHIDALEREVVATELGQVVVERARPRAAA